MNNLVFVQFNANLMEKNKKRKDRNLEVLLANDSHAAQDWIIHSKESVVVVDEVDPETVMEVVDEDVVSDDNQAPEASPARELFDEDFESEEEEVEQVFEDVNMSRMEFKYWTYSETIRRVEGYGHLTICKCVCF